MDESRRPPTSPDSHRVQLLCSFCGKSHTEVERLIAGRGVYICNECIELCAEILVEERSRTQSGEPAEP